MIKKAEISILLFIAMVLSACQPGKQETELKGEAQGTSYHIKLVLDGLPVTAERVQNEVSTVLADIDAKLSNHRDDSEISRINAQETTDWLPVSREIAQLVSIAHTVYEHSDGCYDLTVSPLLDLWGLANKQTRVPNQEEIDALLHHVGMPLLEIDTANQRIRKKDPKLKIDLSSIAQGYSVGMVAHHLEALGINNYWVEIGGEIMVKGLKANGLHWSVGMGTPKPLSLELQQIVYNKEQSGMSIMKSGSYRNFFHDNGQTTSHIINPKTGWPVTHHLESVTVIQDDPAWADAWGTALLCVGEKEAARIMEAEQLKVLLIYDGDSQLNEHMSKAFAAMQ
jgi:thiamine biosynthesis lipoprotein